MSDRFTERLSAYLDGELDDVSRARLEAHLGGCAVCARVLTDLRAIVVAAPHYAGRQPSRDLWNEIESRLDEAEVVPIALGGGPAVQPPSRRFGWRELIAASIVMAAVGGGVVWLALRPAHHTPGPLAEHPPTVAPTQPANTGNVGFAERTYDAAGLLEAGRSRLDTATVRSVEASLQKIDAAIAEARAAIQRDPSNGYLSRQIAANMRSKLNLLRAATNAIATRT
jgi:hypothetical protein